MQENFEISRPEVAAALRTLGIRHFLLGIHDGAFPGLPEEEIGRGSPYSAGAAGFLEFVSSLGFNGLQLGPQGLTTPENPSPYDGTLFSKNPLSLAPLPLTREPWNLLAPEKLAHQVRKTSPPADRVNESFTREILGRISSAIHHHYLQVSDPRKAGFRPRLYHCFDRFQQRNSTWLERDALYEVLRKSYGGKNWRQWREGEQAGLDRNLYAQPTASKTGAAMRIETLYRLYGRAVMEYKFIQYLLAEQHQEFRGYCRDLGLKIFGDCQIGFSGRDSWYAQSFLLSEYLMGAPPSRTNPEGQPWNYPVLDPRQYYRNDHGGFRMPGPALLFVQKRIDKLFDEFDGLRIDHPHGLVCPWVYRAGRKDPVKAVQEGARLFASPSLPDHPELAEFAIPRPDQIDRKKKRHSDNWVISLDQDQVNRYAVLMDIIMDSAGRHGRGTGEIACEILSTQPYPIKRVMELYGLGRFRITQKADLENPADVYRSENSRPEDWLMIGNHDTPSLWEKTAEWVATGESYRQAAYLAERLRIPEEERTDWAERTAADKGELAQARFADLFAGPARNIMVFFTDLLGIEQAYNRPGTVNRENWSLRIPPDYQKRYVTDLKENRALNIPKALALALRARKQDWGEDCDGLIKALESRQ